MTHTGEKKFACEICGKRAARPADLAIHMRSHTGKKCIIAQFLCHINLFLQEKNLTTATNAQNTTTHQAILLLTNGHIWA